MPSLTLEVHPLLHRMTAGVWCDGCLLPSALRVPFVIVDARTLRPALRGAVVVCRECGGRTSERTA